MLILTPENIKSCFVQLPGKPPSIGFQYRNWYFYVDTILKLDFEQALIKSQQWLDTPEEPGELRALLKQPKGGCRLCVHLPELQSVPEYIAMTAICEYMRTCGELNVGTQRHQLRIYQKCFVGSEAVTWLSQNLKISRKQAVEFGRSCLKQGLLHHVFGEHDFEDERLFYRFAQDGEPDKRHKSFVLTS